MIKAKAAADQQSIALPAEQTTAPLIARLAVQLLDLDLDLDIKDIDRQIAGLLAVHPQAITITSVPGFGPLPAAGLLAATGGDLHLAR